MQTSCNPVFPGRQVRLTSAASPTPTGFERTRLSTLCWALSVSPAPTPCAIFSSAFAKATSRSSGGHFGNGFSTLLAHASRRLQPRSGQHRLPAQWQLRRSQTRLQPLSPRTQQPPSPTSSSPASPRPSNARPLDSPLGRPSTWTATPSGSSSPTAKATEPNSGATSPKLPPENRPEPSKQTANPRKNPAPLSQQSSNFGFRDNPDELA
jgi:hypothetical protein